MEADSNGHFPVICAGGMPAEKTFRDNKEIIGSNTCGGDSGGGLFCFDNKDSENKYYFMGVLHGGNSDCRKDRWMYFSNNLHVEYQDFLHRTKI